MAEEKQILIRIQLGEAKRRYPAHFVSKLSDSAGEVEETVHWLETAFACGYLAEELKDSLLSKCNHVGGMLNKMMSNADSWCKNYIDNE